MSARLNASLAAIFAVSLLASGCGGGGSSSSAPPSSAGTPAASRSNVSLDKSAYPVFPNADAGADPAVPAEQGGKGFKGDGWQTNTDFDLIGDPRAVKGGVFREYQLYFPGSLRIYGPETNLADWALVQNVSYETLLSLHPTTLDYIPALATHWQVSPDKLTYRYRLDPNARFSDGVPLTSEDVVASWSFVMDKGLQEPMSQLVYEKFEKPVAESKYIVRVHSKVLNWRNFLYFSASLPILPAHVLKDVDGARYIKDYNFKLLPGTGQYIVNESDIVKGKSITVRRRKDYWGEEQRRNVGTGNFDEMREIVVRDQNLAFEMFKKGDLDYFYVNVPRQWVQELNFDKVQRGLIQKAKVYNDFPIGFRGVAFNTRKAPWSDIKVRQAFTHLANRKLFIEKIYFNEYVPLNSYYPGLYEDQNNPKNEYDPQIAIKLLADAGWKDRDAQGRLVKNGQPLTAELIYANKNSEQWLTLYQDDLRKVGIGLNLRFLTPETLFQLTAERKFDLAALGWGGLVFPNPETSVSSKLADSLNSNNITAFKNARVDELLDVYDKEFDQQKRIAIIREIDGILANDYQYLLTWEEPFSRIAFWNKFGHPEGYLTRIGDYREPSTLWWIDPALDQQLKRAMADPAIKFDVGTVDKRYWQEYDKAHPFGGAPSQ
jgi:microcin C transport system substrate-binding protein